MKILIVDDSNAMRKMIRNTLVKAGYEDHDYREAGNGREGLEVVRDWQPELILTDWHMPETDGLEMIQYITDEGIDVKTALITTERSEENIRKAKDAGALFVLNKPFTVTGLNDAMLEVIPDEVADSVPVATASSDDVDDIFGDLGQAVSLPTVAEFESMLDDLLAAKLTVTDSKDQFDLVNLPTVVGMYADRSNKTRAMLILDFSAACFLGAALEGLGNATVQVVLRSGVVRADIHDNIKEVLQIASGLLHDDENDQPLRLSATHVITQVNAKLQGIVANKHLVRHDLMIEGDYGSGKGAALLVVV